MASKPRNAPPSKSMYNQSACLQALPEVPNHPALNGPNKQWFRNTQLSQTMAETSQHATSNSSSKVLSRLPSVTTAAIPCNHKLSCYPSATLRQATPRTSFSHCSWMAAQPVPSARVALLLKLQWPPLPFQSPGMGLGSKVTST
jgi:hypothetical protein